eukprot:gene18133-biopygen18337
MAMGPRPQRMGYVLLSMMTRLILATMPWSHVAMTDVVISAMPNATISPFVEIIAISSPTAIPSSNRRSPGIINFAPKQMASTAVSFTTTLFFPTRTNSHGRITRRR